MTEQVHATIEVVPKAQLLDEEVRDNLINRLRMEQNILTEPDPEVRRRMAAYALETYPLPSDKE